MFLPAETNITAHYAELYNDSSTLTVWPLGIICSSVQIIVLISQISHKNICHKYICWYLGHEQISIGQTFCDRQTILNPFYSFLMHLPQRNLYRPFFRRLVSSPHLAVSNECNVPAGKQNFSWEGHHPFCWARNSLSSKTSWMD